MIRPSLNRRLVLRLAAGILLVWCLATAWMAWRSVHEVDEIFDQMLVRTAASVLAVMPAAPAPGATARLPRGRILESDRHAQRPAINLRTADGAWLVRSRELPALGPTRETAAFRTVVQARRRWRVFQDTDAGGRYWIQVGAPLDERDELMRKLLAPALLALLALLVLVPPTVYAGLRSGLRPLRRLTATLGADEGPWVPVLTDPRVPGELVGFTRAIDRLVAQLRTALEHEQRFTADAAHELRHPLAALRLELDLAADADATARNAHLARAQAALDRMQRLVGQLLMLARVEKLGELEDAGAVDLAALAGDLLRESSARAGARQIELALDPQGDARVRGSRGLLGIALQNLLDNALRHAPAGGRVEVRIDGRGSAVRISVDDDGEGFIEPERLGERFHRPAGSLGEGSGLGLSIVLAIAALHRASVALDRSPLGGARITLTFARAPTSRPAERPQAH